MHTFTRRGFLQYGAAGGVLLFVPWAARTPTARAARGGKLTKYVQPLPRVGAGIAVAQQTPAGSDNYAFTQVEAARQLHPDLPPTPIWAYDDGHGSLEGQAGSFGTVVAARSGTPVRMSFTNDLPSQYPSWIPVDPRLTPFRNLDGSAQVRVMTHLHGGFVAGDSDGNPTATPQREGKGGVVTALPLRAAVLLASVTLVMALPAAASNAAAAKSLTIRVYVDEVTQSIKDVPPKTFALMHVYTKGDTIRGTESLRNAAPQFNKPRGANVGTDRYVITTVAWQKVRADFVAKFPGGTVHAHGEGKPGVKAEVPIVGGTGLYAGATGSIEGQHLRNGEKLNVYRLQLP